MRHPPTPPTPPLIEVYFTSFQRQSHTVNICGATPEICSRQWVGSAWAEIPPTRQTPHQEKLVLREPWSLHRYTWLPLSFQLGFASMWGFGEHTEEFSWSWVSGCPVWGGDNSAVLCLHPYRSTHGDTQSVPTSSTNLGCGSLSSPRPLWTASFTASETNMGESRGSGDTLKMVQAVPPF